MSTTPPQLPRLVREYIAAEKESARVWLRAEIDRFVGPLVDSVFDRLTNKLMAMNMDWDRILLGDGARVDLVKREIKEENEMTLQNVVDNVPMGNEQIGDCVKREFQEEEEDGQMVDIKEEEEEENETSNEEMMVIKKEENEEDSETQINEIEGLAEGNQGGDGDGSRSVESEPMDCVKQEIKEEFEDGQMLDIKEEEVEGETNEVDLDDDTTDELIASNQSPNRDMSNASTSSNEPSNQNSTNLVDEEGQVNHNTQHQFYETNKNGGMIEEVEEVGDGQTRVTDFEELAANEGDDGESSSVEDAQIGTTPPHLTGQSHSQSERLVKRKPRPQVRNEVNNRDVQEDEEGQIELSSRRVKRPRMDTTQPNNSIGEESSATESSTNPTQPNLAQPNRQWQCSLCPKSFITNCKLQKHLRVHTGERPFQCDLCDKRFSERSNLTQHQLIHQNMKRFRCPECDKQFTLKRNLDAHLLTHSGERPFACRHCDMSFTQPNHRTNHEQAIHLHVKPYRCKQCGHTATRQSDMIKHIRVVHFGLPQFSKQQQALNIIDDRDPRELMEKV